MKLRNLGRTWAALFFIFSFGHLSFFFLSFFSTAQAFFYNETFLRDSNKNNGAFITGTKGMDGKYFWCSLLV
jgi:hypothetical protein